MRFQKGGTATASSWTKCEQDSETIARSWSARLCGQIICAAWDGKTKA